MKKAIERIIDLVEQLPGGIDIEADEDDRSPANAVAHIGGLIWQICQEALEKMESENG